MKTKFDQKEIIASVRKIPLISTSTAKLMQVANDPEHGMQDVVTIVKHDAALTANTLKVVNSAAFASKTPVKALDRAISLLGEDIIVGIALSDAAHQLFYSDLNGYAGKAGDLWDHDLRTAIASKKIAGYAKEKVNEDLAFTCGLLHDLGKALISSYLKDFIDDVLSAIDAGKYKDYPTAEKKMLGLDHGYVGYELAKHWNLPEPLPTVIRFHHEPAQADIDVKPLTYAVHLGDFIAMMSGSGTGADSMCCELDPQYTDFINLTCDELSLILLETDEEFNKAKATLNSHGED